MQSRHINILVDADVDVDSLLQVFQEEADGETTNRRNRVQIDNERGIFLFSSVLTDEGSGEGGKETDTKHWNLEITGKILDTRPASQQFTINSSPALLLAIILLCRDPWNGAKETLCDYLENGFKMRDEETVAIGIVGGQLDQTGQGGQGALYLNLFILSQLENEVLQRSQSSKYAVVIKKDSSLLT